jgi:uncharacterized protein
METIYPALFRRVKIPAYEKERIRTADDDFLDLGWLKKGCDRIIIIQHGLEGSADRPYVKGMARAFFDQGFDVLTWSYRGCSDEMNRQLRFYHSGATDDLDTVIQHAISKFQYKEIFLVGFSLGGNMTLKYLGERTLIPQIKKAVVFSVPMHLESSCRKISLPGNRIYAQRFIKSLKKKILIKASAMKELDTSKLNTVKSLLDFDDAYTAPLHGFKGAIDYYTQNSSIYFLDKITIPTLIVNTKNDPFLSPECFPIEQLQGHPFVKLEIPERGGHVGFALISRSGLYWSEQRAVRWVMEGG